MRKKLIVLIIILLPVFGFAAYTWFTLTWSYSNGERAGYVLKLSQKGWLCKTWEGELAMITTPGAIPEKFLFSVRSDGIAERINRSMGKRVSLRYEQHKGVPTTCFGDTEYFVTDVAVAE